MISPSVGQAGALALLLLGLGGCATAPAARPSMDLTAPPRGWREADDEPSRTMRAVARLLEPLGLTASHEGFAGFLSTSARATHALRVPENTCATLVAIASRAVHDMDATLYSPEGEALASDAQPDPHPTIQVCTGPEAATLYYALQVYDGAGTYLIVPFFGQAATLEAAAKALDAKPGIARLDAPSAGGPSRIAAFREGLERRGFERAREDVRFPLQRDQRLRVPVLVEPGECYTAATFAFEGLDDVNLRVLDDEGAEVARDESGEADASAQFCVDRKAEYAAEVYGTQQPGTALFMLLRASTAAIGGTSGLWLGERPLLASSKIPLADALAAATQRAAHDGYAATAAFSLEGRLAPGEAVAHALALHAKRCARIQAVGGPGVRKLELQARDANGALVASAAGGVDDTYVHLCGTTARELDLQVRAAEGWGSFALTVYEAPATAFTPPGADDRTTAALQQALRSARDAGYAPHGDFRSGPKLMQVTSAEPLSLPINFSGRCVRAYVVSPDAQLKSSLLLAGKSVDEPSNDVKPVRYCIPADKPGAHEVSLRLSTQAARSDAWVLVVVR